MVYVTLLPDIESKLAKESDHRKVAAEGGSKRSLPFMQEGWHERDMGKYVWIA